MPCWLGGSPVAAVMVELQASQAGMQAKSGRMDEI